MSGSGSGRCGGCIGCIASLLLGVFIGGTAGEIAGTIGLVLLFAVIAIFLHGTIAFIGSLFGG